MKRLGSYIKEFIKPIILGPFFKMVEAILELANPILVAKIIDIGVANADSRFIFKMCVVLVMFNIIGFFSSYLSNKFSSFACTGISAHYRKDLFTAVANYSHKELDSFSSASLINRLTEDVNQVEHAMEIATRRMSRVPFLLIGSFVLSLLINVKMSFVFFAFIPIIVLVFWFFMKKIAPFFVKMRERMDSVSKVTNENLSGTRVIRAFNKQKDEAERFAKVNTNYTNTGIKMSKIATNLEPVMLLLIDVATCVVLYVGGIQIDIGGMTQGDLIALIDYIAILANSLLSISQCTVVFVRLHASTKRLDEVIDCPISILAPLKKVADKDGKYSCLMEFKNVSFNYLNNKEVKSFIKDLSFKILPGQTIGIIGGTGSGKTTIASLMARFYDATEGLILYKDKDIKKYPFKQLRKEISIVQQRSTLFSGSLRENMQIRNKHATDDEIIEALKISQAWPFVSEWRNKLDYQIMAGGKNVSGGQMQRLTIARALIDNPELLILDDSSSALDFLTDSNLRKALRTLNTTLVLISQRATSIKNADLIIVLDNGDVVGMGKHSDLIKQCEIYRTIYETQAR